MADSGLSREEKRSALMNVALIMLTDGKAKPEELQVLSQVAERLEVPQSEVEDILQSSGQIKFTRPESDKEKVSQLVDMVMMMSVDGDIESHEKSLCLTLAAGLGFNTAKVAAFLDNLPEHIDKDRKFFRKDLAAVLEQMLLKE
ncbi:MAG: hypothetical protein ACYSUK_08215 [Planctomycetota bacterium]|jgi:tellurite resistance protein